MQPLPRDMQAVQFLLTRPYGRDLLGTANFWLAMFLLTRPYGRDRRFPGYHASPLVSTHTPIRA